MDGCLANISRGSASAKGGSLGNGGMLTHLRTIHPETFKDLNLEKEKRKLTEKDDRDETVRGTKCLYRLRTKQSRQQFLDEVGSFLNTSLSPVEGWYKFLLRYSIINLALFCNIFY